MKDNTINGQSAAKPLNSNIEYEERSTTIETTLGKRKEVEYTINCGKGENLKTTYIYALVNPNTKEIRYIGKTNNLKNRLSQHIRDKSKSYKTSWIKSLNGNVQIIEIDEVPVEEWEFWESYWISQFKVWGFNLVNLTSGGIGHNNCKKSKETITKLKNSLTGKKRSIEFKQKMSRIRKGMVFTEEHKKNLSESHKGLKYPSENYGKHRLRKILQYDLDNNLVREWNSIKEASLFYKVNQSSISHCCAGRKKTIKGFVWKYLD